jgi:hypothetical protein
MVRLIVLLTMFAPVARETSKAKKSREDAGLSLMAHLSFHSGTIPRGAYQEIAQFSCSLFPPRRHVRSPNDT